MSMLSRVVNDEQDSKGVVAGAELLQLGVRRRDLRAGRGLFLVSEQRAESGNVKQLVVRIQVDLGVVVVLIDRQERHVRGMEGCSSSDTPSSSASSANSMARASVGFVGVATVAEDAPEGGRRGWASGSVEPRAHSMPNRFT